MTSNGTAVLHDDGDAEHTDSDDRAESMAKEQQTYSLANLSLDISEISTLIFEIQELRHLNPVDISIPKDSSNSNNDNNPPAVDTALINLEARLDTVSKQIDYFCEKYEPKTTAATEDEDTETLASSNTESTPQEEIAKWSEIKSDWAKIEAQVDMLRDELKEDKWLVVFRTVGQQAEDMMDSLEKVLSLCHQFVWQVHNHQTSASSASSSSVHLLPSDDPANIQRLLSTFISLHRSFHQKTKYYTPSTERVLKVLDKGITERSTRNGEVLRRFADMKSRWRSIKERCSRISLELDSVQDFFSTLPSSATATAPTTSSSSNGDNTTYSTPNKPSSTSNNPFRRLANRVSPQHSNTPLTKSSSSSSSASASSVTPSSSSCRLNYISANTHTPCPPNRHLKPNLSSNDLQHQLNNHYNNSSKPPKSRLSHKYSQSALLEQRRATSPISNNRPLSPDNGTSSRPAWNISTRLDPKEERVLPKVKSPASPSSSVYSAYRSARKSTGSPLSGSLYNSRPSSPTDSLISAASSKGLNHLHHNPHQRPSSPSRIPAPVHSSAHIFRSATPFQGFQALSTDSASTSNLLKASTTTEDTAVSNKEEEEDLAITASVNASQRRSRRSSAGSSSSSYHRRLNSGSNNGSENTSPPLPPVPDSFRYAVQTPEPQLQARARKVAALYRTRSPQPHVQQQVGTRSINLHKRKSLTNVKKNGSPNSTAASSITSHSRSPSSSHLNASKCTSPIPGPTIPEYIAQAPHDILDVEMAKIINSQPLSIHLRRVDKYVTTAEAKILGPNDWMARYEIDGALLMCKLVDRRGRGRKIMVRYGGGWHDIDMYLLSRQASTLAV